MRTRIWVAIAALIPSLIWAQQRPPPPQQFRPQRFPPPNRDQSNSVSGENSALPQPPLFLTSPSFSFDDIPPSTTSLPSVAAPTQVLPSFSQSTRPARPQTRRPFVRPVEFVQLQAFRPTPRLAQLPIRPRFRTTTSQFRPTQPAVLRRIPPNNQVQIRPRFQPQPPSPTAPARRPTPTVQRTPPIQVRPASGPPQTTVRRTQAPSPTQSALQIRPLTQPAAPRAQQFSRAPTPPSRPQSPQAFTPGLRSRPTIPRPTQPLPSPSNLPRPTATTAQRRPIPSSPSFVSTNLVGPATPSRHAVRPHTPTSAHPPGFQPPSNSVVDELNRADDFIAVATRLKLRRFARHRNRRHADFIYSQQQMKNL